MQPTSSNREEFVSLLQSDGQKAMGTVIKRTTSNNTTDEEKASLTSSSHSMNGHSNAIPGVPASGIGAAHPKQQLLSPQHQHLRPPTSKRGYFGYRLWYLYRLWRKIPRPVKYVGITIISAMITFHMLKRERNVLREWDEYEAFLKPSAKEQRCYVTHKGARRCTCPDPTTGIPQKGHDAKLWMDHHNAMVKQANQYRGKDLDIVMLGDSIIEQWNGTRHLGTETLNPAMKQLFNEKFTKAGGGKYDGLALGSSGDTGPNLLYHLQHGVLDPLNPKVWLILIGSHDMFVSQCTDPYVIANILNVVRYLYENRPDAKVIVHGIMPRLEQMKRDGLRTPYNNFGNSVTAGTSFNGTLGRKYQERLMLGKDRKRSQTINSQLKKFCNFQPNMYFMQGGSVFLSETDVKGRVKINLEMLEDGINPSLEGMKAWRTKITEKLDGIFGYVDESEIGKNYEEVELDDRGRRIRRAAGTVTTNPQVQSRDVKQDEEIANGGESNLRKRLGPQSGTTKGSKNETSTIRL